MMCFRLKEFTGHPNGIAGDPQADSQVMEKLCFHFACSPENINGYAQRRRNHGHTTCFPFIDPAGILDQPQEDMPVLDQALCGRGSYVLILLMGMVHNTKVIFPRS